MSFSFGSSWGTRPRITAIDDSDSSDSDAVMVVILMKIKYFDHIFSGFFIPSIMSFNFGSSWGTRPRSTGSDDGDGSDSDDDSDGSDR
jgi:hypothetical protein